MALKPMLLAAAKEKQSLTPVGPCIEATCWAYCGVHERNCCLFYGYFFYG